MPEPVLSPDADSRLYSHQQELLTRGYTIVPDVLSASELEELREVVDALYRLHDPRIDFEGLNVADGRPDGQPMDNSGHRRQYNFATCLLTKHSSTLVPCSNNATLSGAGAALDLTGPYRWHAVVSVTAPIGATPELAGSTTAPAVTLDPRPPRICPTQPTVLSAPQSANSKQP